MGHRDGMALPNKLSSLAGQLASVQEENDTIRGRYLELESAWQGMIDENKAVHEKNIELRDALEASRAQNAELETEKAGLAEEVAALKAGACDLEQQLAAAKETLREEQLSVGKSNVMADTL